MRLDPIEIVEYDVRRPALFEEQRRRDPADRAECARIKRELAAADDEDRPAYRAGKAPFITGVLTKLGV
ncbi:GrpB protein [Kribbella voronezhensis]|uniref:GrpB protein n=1 Tax=Kribbella voronezhensis TaxID=2512212 RepID=A0A4R7TCD9_9ACTN|nr:GrpB family protein [Kribbella voronezhensis]TDU89685.1 GrpB protein [Kribbella voronezhensis]